MNPAMRRVLEREAEKLARTIERNEEAIDSLREELAILEVENDRVGKQRADILESLEGSQSA